MRGLGSGQTNPVDVTCVVELSAFGAHAATINNTKADKLSRMIFCCMFTFPLFLI
jgi:hypothetical protein